MKRKIYISLFAIASFVIGVYANQPTNESVGSDENPAVAAEGEPAGSQKDSPISYKVYKPKYSNDYSIDFYNHTGHTLEVKYVYATPYGRDGWIINWVKVPGRGKNLSNAAGPYGNVDILDVYRP